MFKIELVLFLKHCLKRGSILIPSFLFYCNFIALTIKKRILKSAIHNYPHRIMKLYSYSKNYNILFSEKPSNFKQIDFIFNTPLVSTKIAIQDWYLEISSFRDEEEVNSLHRCYWFLYDYSIFEKLTTSDLNNLIKTWIFENQYKKNEVSWHPYSSTERVVSYCIAFLLKGSFDQLKDDIRKDNNIKSLFNNTIINNLESLEYYPGGISYNHVVNDLRGILISSILLEDEKLKDEVFNQLIFELESVLDGDGILREGSSHYHLIVTRWILELEFFLKESNESELQDRLVVFTIKMLKGVSLFILGMPKSKIPLFGDISPDFDPDWLMSYFNEIMNNVASAKTYATLLKSKFDLREHIYYESMSEIFSLLNYTKISKGDWIVFMKHQLEAVGFFPNHAHDDNLNIIVYYKGNQLVIDPGRDSYLIPPSKNVFCSSESHNIGVVNGISLGMPESLKYYFPFEYYKSEFKKELMSDKQLKLKISTSSYRSVLIDIDSKFNREVIVDDESITINDYIESSCTTTIDIDYKLCFGPTCRFVDGGEKEMTINMSGIHFKLYTYTKTDRIESEKYCPAYNNVGDTVAAKWISSEKIKSFKLKIA